MKSYLNHVRSMVSLLSSSVQFWMVSIRPGKEHLRYTPYFRRFSNVAFETVPKVVYLTTVLSRPLGKSSFQASLLLVIGGVVSFALCP